MRDSKDRILYIGKAANLKRRVSSYFERPHDFKTERLVAQITKVDYRKTDTAIEALLLESQLIKKYKPTFNVKEKDDKNFLSVFITKEEFPRVLLSRGKGDFGPFTSATSIRETLRIIRRIFSYSVHPPLMLGRFKRACLDYELGLCPGTCIGAISRKDYLRNIKNIKLFFAGKKQQIIKSLEKEMNQSSKKLEFERAEKLRRQLFSLQHIQDVSLITDEDLKAISSKLKASFRIEGYDVSNISGTSATGSMVVSINGNPDKSQYRKFRIRTIKQSNDTGMLKEVLCRRFRNAWPLPNLIMVDGGLGQVNAGKEVISEFGLKIPVVGIAKGAKRKNNRIIGKLPKGVDEKILVRLRNEAHRFAISYHKKLRVRKSFDI